jgi:hypothetical protein
MEDAMPMTFGMFEDQNRRREKTMLAEILRVIDFGKDERFETRVRIGADAVQGVGSQPSPGDVRRDSLLSQAQLGAIGCLRFKTWIF